MPATRQRTENWHKCLWQVYERGGALEIALPNADDPGADAAASTCEFAATDLIWRVRILGLNDTEILVESPCALGQAMYLQDGIELVGAIVIGQNRWMFRTHIIGHVRHKAQPQKTTNALRLELPTKVERCGRRNFYRVSTAELTLPRLKAWPLIDPATAVVAEHANEEQVRATLSRLKNGNDDDSDRSTADEIFSEQIALPEVGPPFEGRLANIGGGGIGIVVEQDAASALTSNRVFWLQFALPPEIPAALAVTAKLVHTHIDSAQRTYAGFAFDFSRNRQHEQFIVEQLTRYVEGRQDAQLRRAA